MAALNKFVPEQHKGNTCDAFSDFVDAFAYEYDAIAKDPPVHLKELEENEA